MENGEKELSPQECENKRFEYQMAQEMLRHYDLMSWQVGAIFIAGIFVLTGLVLNKDTIELMRSSRPIGWVLVITIPSFSFLILGLWRGWVNRQTALYNYRNEVFHRIEIKLGMYHYLRVVEAHQLQDKPKNYEEHLKIIKEVKRRAGYSLEESQNCEDGKFKPIYPDIALGGTSGARYMTWLTYGIPIAQLALLAILLFTSSLTPNHTTARSENQPAVETPIHNPKTEDDKNLSDIKNQTPNPNSQRDETVPVANKQVKGARQK